MYRRNFLILSLHSLSLHDLLSLFIHSLSSFILHSQPLLSVITHNSYSHSSLTTPAITHHPQHLTSLITHNTSSLTRSKRFQTLILFSTKYFSLNSPVTAAKPGHPWWPSCILVFYRKKSQEDSVIIHTADSIRIMSVTIQKKKRFGQVARIMSFTIYKYDNNQSKLW